MGADFSMIAGTDEGCYPNLYVVFFMMKKTTIILFVLSFLFNLSPFMTGVEAGRNPASIGSETHTLLWDYNNAALVLH